MAVPPSTPRAGDGRPDPGAHPERRPALRVLAAIVVPPHLAASGGARAGEQLSAALADRCQVTVANMMGDALAPDRSCRRRAVATGLPPLVPWSRLSNRYSTLFYRSDIPDAIRPGAYDLVHLHNPMPALEFARIARACRRAGIPYVISTHGFNEVANGRAIYGFGALRRLAWASLVEAPVAAAVRGAAAIFALSPADFEIVRAMGFKGQRLEVVPNGVAMPEPADPEADRATYERFGIPAAPDGPLTAMFLANHTPNKGLPVLMDGFLALDDPFTLIVGGENRPDVDYAAYQRAAKPGQRIVVTGRLTDAEVGALLRRSDLFVFPTLADTLPLVIFEAMAQGLPVVASRVGGIPHQIDASCGELVPPGDATALRDALERLMRDRPRLARMGLAARARVAERFTWEAAADKALTAYHDLLDASGRDRRTAEERSAAVGAVPAHLVRRARDA